MLHKNNIEKAKKEIKHTADNRHEHDDCIRIAYAWLDAQKKTTRVNKRMYMPLKHLIENWAGRYVSQSDVEVAAHLHPKIIGIYPNYNISSLLCEPSLSRLKNIDQAFIHEIYREIHDIEAYSRREK